MPCDAQSRMLEGARFPGVRGRARTASIRTSNRPQGTNPRGRKVAQHEGNGALAAQDSVLSQIARPYASALFDIAQAQGSVAAVEQGLVKLLALSDESPDFARFLRSPVINTEEKSVAMHVLLEKAQAHTTVGNFVKVVARNGRLFALPAIVRSFQEMAAKARGEIAADVTSAVPLSADQIKTLADTLKAKIGKSVTLSQHVDPSLIGGLVVKVGSQMIDSSLKTKLTAMKIAMKEVG